jgi:hypothetical protein
MKRQSRREKMKTFMYLSLILILLVIANAQPARERHENNKPHVMNWVKQLLYAVDQKNQPAQNEGTTGISGSLPDDERRSIVDSLQSMKVQMKDPVVDCVCMTSDVTVTHKVISTSETETYDDESCYDNETKSFLIDGRLVRAVLCDPRIRERAYRDPRVIDWREQWSFLDGRIDSTRDDLWRTYQELKTKIDNQHAKEVIYRTEHYTAPSTPVFSNPDNQQVGETYYEWKMRRNPKDPPGYRK